MPMVDMPLDKLREYQGQSPCPADIDEFWDAELKELDSIDPEVELIPIDHPSPNVNFYDLYFTSAGGARIHAIFAKPLEKFVQAPMPAVVEFHGYSGSCGSATSKMIWAAGMGMAVASMDCRGQGGSSEDKGGVKGNTLRGHIIRGIDSPKTLLFKYMYLDTVMLTRIIMGMDDIDETRIAAHGGSQGGGLTLAAASLEPRIACAVACFPFLSDYKRVWDMDCSGAYEEIREWFRKFDPLHKREEEIFNTLGYIDVQNLVKRIKNPVLYSVGLRDTVCPPSTIYASFNKVTAEKEILIYPDFGHEGLLGWDDELMKFIAKNLL